MTSLVAATLLFLGIHILVSGTALRGRIVAALGEKPYLGLFSLASLGSIVWMVLAYRGADLVILWWLGAAARHAAYLLMLVAIYLVVAGLTTPNPTAAGGDKLLEGAPAAPGIMKVTRHPFLWGVAVWALAHLLVNGDLASLIFFGGFGLLALIGPQLIDAKLAARKAEGWRRYAAATSWLPFLAMAQGRVSLNFAELGWWRFALALTVYVAFLLWLHDWLIGVPLLVL